MSPAPPLISVADRDLRQRELVPAEKIAACGAVVIGVGAIGRQVALQLAAMGIGQMELFDHDTVEVVNLACQGYCPRDLGRHKVEATAEQCWLLNPDVPVTHHPQRFRRSSPKSMSRFEEPGTMAVFCCVDGIATRKLVWETLRPRASFFVDGRMSAEIIRVLASPQPAEDAYYAATLFAPDQAYAGSCTAKSTIYTASIAAGLMLGQFTRWLRGLPVDHDLSVNLLSSEMSVA